MTGDRFRANITAVMDKSSNSRILIFFLKSGLVYVVWYLLYEMWVLPDGTIDRILSIHIAEMSSIILSFFNYSVFWLDRVVGITGNAGIEIVNGCNGIAAMGLFIGFVIAFPGKWINRLLFIAFGTFIIYLVNVSRILVLALTQEYWPQFFDITHDYSTTAIFYFVIFLLWIVWANYGEKMDQLFTRKQYNVA